MWPRAILLLALVVGATTASQQVKPNESTRVNFCQGCRSLVSFVRAFNSSNDREQNRDIVQNFCDLQYPPSADFQQGPCPIFVEGFFYVVDHLDPVHHCDQIGACGRVTEDSFDMMPVANSGLSQKGSKVVCEFCEQVVEQTQATLSDPAIVEMVRRQIDSLCDYLMVVGQEKQCKQLMHQYLSQAIDFIKTIDPLDYCRSISMCSKSSQRSRAPTTPKTLPTLTDFNNFGIETSVVIGGAQPTRDRYELDLSKTSHRNGPNCMLCKTVVKELFHFVRENKTEANIMRGLDQVCKLIYRRGASFEQCESMVKAYTKEIIQLLIDETDPEVICMLLEQCHYDPGVQQGSHQLSGQPRVEAATKRTRSKHTLGSIITAFNSSIGLNSARACFECKLFIKYLKNELEDEKSLDSMKKWLVNNVCGKLPDKNSLDACTQMVDDYSDTFFKAIAGSLNEKEACIEFGVCRERLAHKMIIDLLTGQQQPVVISPPPPPAAANRVALATQRRLEQIQRVKGQLCDQCIKIVTQIDEYLSSHSVDQDVKVLIEQVCNKLPDGAGRDECTLIVKYFGSEIVQIIASMDNPRQVCSKIYQC